MTSLADLKSDKRNARRRTDRSATLIGESLKRYGAARSIVIDEDNTVLAGNGTLEQAQAAGISNVRIIEAEGDELIAVRRSNLSDADKVGLAIADNRTSDLSDWDAEMLRQLDAEYDLAPWFDEDEIPIDEIEEANSNTDSSERLSDKFGIAPLTVLNAREGWWQERKRQWLALGIESEVGRKGNLLKLSDTLLEPDSKVREYKKMLAEGTHFASAEMLPGFYEKRKAGMTELQIIEEYTESGSKMAGTSIFDPVLTELLCRWFSKEGDTILDPFAGGSVRGIVSARLKRKYIGVELRKEQVDANIAQADKILDDTYQAPAWINGNSMNIDKHCSDVKARMILSCPPYADLEIYSNDPNDISNMPYDQFHENYRNIIARSVSLLDDNAFACFVVGDIRDKKGNYRNFPAHTIQAFIDAGCSFYNEAVLVTPVGTLAMRAGKAFTASRKLGKTHQNVLIFVKGDGKVAAAQCGTCDFADTDPAEELGDIIK